MAYSASLCVVLRHCLKNGFIFFSKCLSLHPLCLLEGAWEFARPLLDKLQGHLRCGPKRAGTLYFNAVDPGFRPQHRISQTTLTLRLTSRVMAVSPRWLGYFVPVKSVFLSKLR